MKVSVITVALNNAGTIGDTLDSVAAQTHSDYEHIVVDGNSSDGTQDIVTSFRGHRPQLVSEPDRGIYDAMNKGISLATGDVVGFLNADDFFTHSGVLQQIAHTMQEPEVEGCYADLVYVMQNDTSRVVRYWKSRNYHDGLFERGWMPAHPTFYVRRQLYLDHGGYDLAYPFHSDEDMAARLMAVHRIHTRYVPEVWVTMRLGGATNRSIGNVIRGNRESYRALRKLGLKVTPGYFVTKFSMRLRQFFQKPPKPT